MPGRDRSDLRTAEEASAGQWVIVPAFSIRGSAAARKSRAVAAPRSARFPREQLSVQVKPLRKSHGSRYRKKSTHLAGDRTKQLDRTPISCIFLPANASMRRYAIMDGEQTREKANHMAQTTTDTAASTVSGAGAASSFSGGTGTEAEFGSLGALSPPGGEPEDGSEPEPWLTPDQAFERFFEWTSDRGIELWDHQEEALMDLAAGDHVILGTPTGSGKSLVALGMLFMGMAQGKRCYYTAPIKALVSEKFFDLVQVLGRDNVGMITGDTHINTKAPVICCTAEILANDALREGEDADVGCVAMDEFHYFADPDRGWAWQVPLLTLPHTQFMLMSATLGDVTAIAASLEEHTGATCDLVVDAPRPVPLSYDYVTTSLEGTVELAMRRGEAPLYIVHFSQDAALATAQSLANFGIASKEQREAIKEAAKGTSFSAAFGKILKRLLGCGVGVHHAGMLPRYRLPGRAPGAAGPAARHLRHRYARRRHQRTHPYRGAHPRSPSSAATRCVACAPVSSIKSLVAPVARALTPRGMVIAEAPGTRSRTPSSWPRRAATPKSSARLKREKAPGLGFVTWNKADL